MSKIVIKDTNKFENIINELENTLPSFEDVFKNQDKNFSMIDGTDIWKGDTQKVITSKYNDLRKNYDSIDETLRNYIKYLKITVDNYKRYEEMVDKSVSENEENLNVN
jgi:hypothetical protein